MSESLRDMIARLEAATGDRELDAEIAAITLGGEIVWKQTNFTMGMFPVRRFETNTSLSGWASEPIAQYTTSIDAALTLVPEGWRLYKLGQNTTGGTWDAELASDGDTEWWYGNNAATPALALCIAALRARAADLDGPKP